MVWLILWPIIVVTFVTERKRLKTFGFTVAIIASVLVIILSGEYALIQLLAVGFCWIISFLIAKGIRRAKRKERDDP